MPHEDQNVLVIKLNTRREETWRYEGRIVARGESGVLIEAFFNRDDLPFHGITLQSKRPVSRTVFQGSLVQHIRNSRSH